MASTRDYHAKIVQACAALLRSAGDDVSSAESDMRTEIAADARLAADNIAAERAEAGQAIATERAARVAAEGECERLRAELAAIHSRRFPIMSGPSVPWLAMVPFESQAQKNHGQSLQELAGRGGLSPEEAWCVVNGKRWRERHCCAADLWAQWAERQNAGLLDSPDAGAKGEVRCSRCHGDGYPECACKVDE